MPRPAGALQRAAVYRIRGEFDLRQNELVRISAL
jgi:hypothetical protein